MRGRELALDTAVIGNSSETAQTPALISEAHFEQFYRRNSEGLWAYLYRMGGDASLADDVLQKAFYRFLRTPLRSAEEAQLRGLLYKIGTNLMHDHWRSEKREKNWRTAMPGDEPSVPASDSALRNDMQKVFDRLKPQERTLLWMAHVEGADHREVAEVVGVKENSVKVMLFRARAKLGRLLADAGLSPEGKR
ncbi:MAG: RNA polymerase sigma factor [Acidobacteriota bacterium]